MIIFPDYAIKCIEIITKNGFEAFFVGGCVRDGLLGRSCYDIDITTSATPNEIISLFEQTVPTGIKHGTVTVIIDEQPIEVTTYRQDCDYTDSRHPDKVVFVSNLHEDLSRRDFTINALACSKDGEIIDLFNGMKDLQAGIIRTVGDPEKRFDEDALRIVRAYRFSSVLGFEIENRTRIAALKLSHKITELSGERLLNELKKCVCGKHPSAICELIKTDAFSRFGIRSQLFGNEIIDRLTTVEISPSSMLAIFISLFEHDTELLKSNLKVDRTTFNSVVTIDEFSKHQIPNSKIQIKKMLSVHLIAYVRVYFYYLMTVNAVTDNSLFEMLDDILNSQEPYKISHLKIDGNDLMKLGFEGPQIKAALETALSAVINGELQNTKDALIQFLKN